MTPDTTTLPATVDAARHAVGALRDVAAVLCVALARYALALDEGDAEAAGRYEQHIDVALERFERADAATQAALNRLWVTRNMEPTP